MTRLVLFFRSTREVVYLDGKAQTIVGRSSVCTLRVEGLIPTDKVKLISRRHFALTLLANEGFIIEDLGSQNGTRVNGIGLAPGAPVFLKRGDVIQLAQSDDLEIDVREEHGARTDRFEEASLISPLYGLLFRSPEGEFVVDGRVVHHSLLSTLESRLLNYLYDNSGRVCTYRELVLNVWEYPRDAEWQSNIISKTVSNLRKKLDEQSAGSGRRHIHVAHGRGVKLTPL